MHCAFGWQKICQESRHPDSAIVVTDKPGCCSR
jgi:hypothetical protein